MAQQLKTDWTLFITVLAMVVCGILIVYSASSVMAQMDPHYRNSWHYVQRQAMWGALALALMNARNHTYYRNRQNPACALIFISMSHLLLLMVLVLDPANRRWISLGPIHVQPSELAKPALVIFLAFFVTWRGRRAR